MEPADHPITERVEGERGRIAAFRVGLAVVIVLGAALFKPWEPVGDDVADAPPGRPADAARSPRSTSPIRPAPAARDDEVTDLCLRPLGWRVIATEIWVDRTARTWKAIDAVEASGPDDPAIQMVLVTGEAVPRLGWCAPVVGPEIPPVAARATIFALRSRRPVELTTRLLEPTEPGSGGGVWAPPDDRAAPPAATDSWPAGRYVIRIATPDGRFERWLGAKVLPPARERAAAPAALMDPVFGS